MTKKEYTILTGSRQTGKSTLLRQLERHCQQHHMPVAFINLENKTLLADLNSSPLNLLNYLPETSKRVVVLVDEVQYLDDASNFLKLLHDEHAETIKIVATGSSAFYIDKAFRDSLAGRKRLFHLPTCSFEEHLELSGKNDLLTELDHIRQNEQAKSVRAEYLKNEWYTYMTYGGYPAVITETDLVTKKEIVKEIRDSFVKRDILESGVTNEVGFYNLMRILAGQCGSLVNVNELSSTLRMRHETVNNYLGIMRKCFHISLVRPFYRNLRKELVKMPKVYFNDNGLRNSLINNFQQPNIRIDRGDLWENTVYRELANRYGDDEIHYWRTTSGNEVDFVLPNQEQPLAIEAKFDQSQIRQNKYKVFRETYPDISLSFSCLEPFDTDLFRKLL